MNSKQRRRLRRSGGHTPKEMNDFCPYIYKCPNPNHVNMWDCFGRYTKMDCYKTATETNSRMYQAVKSIKDLVSM